MPAFLETQLDPMISFGAQGGPKFKTTILELGSGFERRNVDWSSIRSEYDIAYKLKFQSELDVIRALFFSVRGRAYGFRFKDWTDYVMPRQQIGVTDGGVTVAFQLIKTYIAGVGSYDRPIKKPVADTQVIYVNGVAIAPPDDYAIDTTTGIVTLSTASAASTGDLVEAQCEFDVPVRFDIDHLAASIDHYNVLSVSSIPLVELRTS